MACSPCQHVPGTPCLNISFNLHVGLQCSTPEQSVPRTPYGTSNKLPSCRTPRWTPSWTPYSGVSSGLLSPHCFSSSPVTSSETRKTHLRRKGSLEKSSSLSFREAKMSGGISNLENTRASQALLDDFQIVPDIAWVERNQFSDDENRKCSSKSLVKQSYSTATKQRENLSSISIDENIWG